jgi:two-component sensor histidine kinase
MSWTEREGPPASQLKQRGFGTVVVEALGAAQWDGGSAGDDLRGLR